MHSTHSHCNHGPASPTAYIRGATLAALCALGTVIGYFGDANDWPWSVTQAAYLLAYISGGWVAAKEAYYHLRERYIDIHVLMILVAIGAWIIRAQEEGAILLFLFSLSNALEAFAEYRTKRAVSDLYKNFPTFALRRNTSGQWERVAIDTLGAGDELQIRPGDMIPVDGIVIEGSSSLDESSLTGEATPIAKQTDDEVWGGTINYEGQLVIRATQPPQESAAQRIVRLVEDTHREKAPAQRLTDFVGRYYTIIVLVGSIFAFFVFAFVRHQPLDEAFYATMVLLVVASPCALVVSIPSAVLAAVASGSRHGILFRGGRAIEELSRVTIYALDKTGTLTKGRFIVDSINSQIGNVEKLIKIAASVETASTHPLALAIVRHAQNKQFEIIPPQNVRNVPGAGIEATVDGELVRAGKFEFAQELNSSLRESPPISGKSEVYIASSTVAGKILLVDELRPRAKEVVQRLQDKERKVVLLSGDRSENVAGLAHELGIDSYAGELTPEDKLERIHSFKEGGTLVAMTGDGVNDAPSLAAADVAIVLGDRASDAAIEEADIVLMAGGIALMPLAMQLSARARRVIAQNLVISIGTVVFLVVAALYQQLSLPVGVIGHEGSSVIVVLNSLRLLRVKKSRGSFQ